MTTCVAVRSLPAACVSREGGLAPARWDGALNPPSESFLCPAAAHVAAAGPISEVIRPRARRYPGATTPCASCPQLLIGAEQAINLSPKEAIVTRDRGVVVHRRQGRRIRLADRAAGDHPRRTSPRRRSTSWATASEHSCWRSASSWPS